LSFLLIISLTASAQTQATRTWVSGVGDDVNPCSRTAPCKTFAGAISKTSSNGEINCIDPGGYGSITITKSITIDCTGTQGSILGANVNGVTISGNNIAVRLRGLNINGASTGQKGAINTTGASVTIENTIIDGFIVALAANGPSKYMLSNVTFRNNGTAIIAASGSNVHLFASRIFGNKVGLDASGGNIISYKNNLIAGNEKDGVPTTSIDPK
jgi:hypothetical protein